MVAHAEISALATRERETPASFAEYARYDGVGLADLVRRKEVHPIELVEAAIEGIEQLNPTLNAVINKTYDAAREAARNGGHIPVGEGPNVAAPENAPFAGVPFLVKDIFHALAGEPLTNGCRYFRGYVPAHDAEIIRRMKRAGVIVLGKTNTPELGLLPVTEPELFGATLNPWDHTRTPGGSSGGAGAAVASRMVPMAHADDGGGSIRIPASCCGLFGLKPTRARTPIGPDFSEIWMGGVCEHVLTRSVRDSATMLDALAGPETGARYHAPPPERPYAQEIGEDPGRLRIALSTEPLLGGTVHPECAAAAKQTAALLEDLGHTVEEASPTIDSEGYAKAFLLMVAAETWASIEDSEALLGRRARPSDFEATTWLFALLGRQYRADELSRAVRTLHQFAQVMGRFHTRYDVLLTPTLSKPPIPMNSVKASGLEGAVQRLLARFSSGRAAKLLGGLERTIDQVLGFTPYTAAFNMTGQPAMSVPLVWSEAGLPIGLQFVGRFGDEATLFRLAAQLEQARPWAERTPPVGGLAAGPSA